MMVTAIKLAINAYSIAVTPNSSLRKFRTRNMGFPPDALRAPRSQAAIFLSKDFPSDRWITTTMAKSHPAIANASI